MRSLWVVTRYTFPQLFTGRRLAISLLLGALPVLLAGTVIGVRRLLGLPGILSPRAFYHDFTPGYFHTWAILAGMLYGSSAVSEDEEDGSVVYLLVRPIRRGIVYLGKVLAGVLASVLVLLPPLLVMTAVLVLGGGEASVPALATLLQDAGWILLAGIAYPIAFSAVSALGSRPLHFAAAYLFLWEVPLAFAPTALRYLTVSHYVLSLMPHTRVWNAAVSTLGLVTPTAGALLGLLAVSTAYLALGSVRYERKEHLTASGM